MRQLLQIFFGLLMPLIALFTLLLTGYYSLEYNLDKSIKLALLLGVIIGFGVSFISSIAIFIMRLGTQPRVATYKEQKMQEKEKKQHEDITVIHKENTTQSEFNIHHFIMLMDKTIAYELSKEIIKNKKVRKEGYHHNFEAGVISIKNIHEFIKINIASLTKHTVKISIESKKSSPLGEEVIQNMKEQELSLLNYT